MVLEHASVYASVLTLKFEGWRWCFGIENEMVVTVRAILVTTRRVQPMSKSKLLFLNAHQSSNSWASLRKHFLHFLQANVYSLQLEKVSRL